MTTVLDKELKRQISVDGANYTVTLDPNGFRMTGKGKRNPEVMLRWRDLLNGDAAMSFALNASLAGHPSKPPSSREAPDLPIKRKAKQRTR